MTTTPATQALSPVTPEDREAAAPFATGFGYLDGYSFSDSHLIREGRKDDHALVQAFARHRQAHSLPGDAVRSGILWQLGVCADNYEREGKEVEARITRWHMGWIEHATFNAALPPSALSPEHCQRCGHNNPSWSAPSPLWNAVIRGGSIDGEPTFGDMVCAACFMELAEQQGIASDWSVNARNVAVPLETTTPSGRVWDDDKGLWVSALSGDAGEVERLREQLQAVEGALVLLEQAAREVHRKGAIGGAQWPKLAGALVRARAWIDTSSAALSAPVSALATEAE